MKLQASGFCSGQGRALCAAALLAQFAPVVTAQALEARCEKLLPQQALNAAVGAGFKAYDATERKPGEMECSWLNRSSGSIKTLFVGHKSKAGLVSWGSNFAPAKSANEWWDMAVTNTEEAMKTKRQLVNGVGKRAALVAMPAGGQSKLFIQRDDDVVEMVVMGLNNADVTKIAKALAAP
jgi:hypothetical protein